MRLKVLRRYLRRGKPPNITLPLSTAEPRHYTLQRAGAATTVARQSSEGLIREPSTRRQPATLGWPPTPSGSLTQSSFSRRPCR
eukprot:5271417-Pleurochrysis_carterae.AAC.1